jgi:transcriptional regulator with XRE-family HTH domain
MIKVVLQSLLEARGLSLEQVAQDTGLERSMLAKLAAGKTSIGLHTMDVLCEYLKIEPGDLFKREPGEAAGWGVFAEPPQESAVRDRRRFADTP